MGSSSKSAGRLGPRAWLAWLAWLCAGWVALTAGQATAQDTTTSTAKVAIVEPLSLTKLEDLDFGKVSYTAAGTVVLTPTATPTCTVTGGVLHYGVCTAAVFEGFGESGRTVRIKLPSSARIDLAGPAGATMRISNVNMDGSPALLLAGSGMGFRRYRIVSTDGAFEFRVGGTLNVAAGQALGLYTATFNVEIAYE